jgi:hypothetical protein
MGSQSSKEFPLEFKIVSIKEDAQQLLDRAELIDLYLENCFSNKTNAKARLSLNYHANSMTYRELKMFEVILENAKPLLPHRLKHDLREVHLIQLMPSADGGMPHTRPENVICYPDVSRFLTTSTLIHELWHIHQRHYEAEWDKIFQALGWNHWDSGYLPNSLEDHRRYNPDTLHKGLWAYDRTWIPVPIFKDISKPNVRETEIWFYNIHTKYHRKSPPETLQLEYPSVPPSAFEHPCELTAYLLSEPDKYQDLPMFKKLIDLVGHVSISP